MRLAPHPVTLRQLQYLVAVADRSSFRGAAEACHVAQPSLSAQVAAAEDALGVKVFERDSKRVLVTPAGREVIARARVVLAEADQLVDLMRALGDPLAGELRLGVIPTIAPYLLPAASARVRAAFPRLTVYWVEDKTPNLAERLASGDLDGAVLALEADLPELERAVIGKDRFLLAVAPEHRLAKGRAAVALESLEGEPMLLLEDGHCFRTQALAACAGAGVVEAGFRATSLATLVQVAAQGHAVTLLPELAVGLENRSGALTLRPLRHPPARTLALVWRPGSPLGPALLAIGAVLATAYGEQVTTGR